MKTAALKARRQASVLLRANPPSLLLNALWAKKANHAESNHRGRGETLGPFLHFTAFHICPNIPWQVRRA